MYYTDALVLSVLEHSQGVNNHRKLQKSSTKHNAQEQARRIILVAVGNGTSILSRGKPTVKRILPAFTLEYLHDDFFSSRVRDFPTPLMALFKVALLLCYSCLE